MAEFLDFAAFLCAPAIGLALGVVLVRFTWWAWKEVNVWQVERERADIETARIRADAQLVTVAPGVIRMERGQLALTIADQLRLAVAQIEASRTHAPVPATIHYSVQHAPPALAGEAAPQLLDPMALPGLAPPPDFWSLYRAGDLPAAGFLMGYDLQDGHAITADWRKLYSALIGGQSGSGKSTLVRSILAQSALQGGRFVVIDPHAGSGDESLAESLDPLRRLMLCDPASNDDAIRDALAYVANVGKCRLAGHDKDRTPLILVVDELTGLLTRGAVADDLLTTLGMIAQETRKVGVYALAIGQQFHSRVIDTTVRNSFVSFVSCRARRDVARVMSGSTEFARLAETLTTGQAAWMTPAGEVEVLAVPNTTQEHLTLVAERLQSGVATASYSVPQLAAGVGHDAMTTPERRQNDAGATGVIEVDGARLARVRQMVASQTPFAEIMREVWGVTSQDGHRYRTARSEFESIISRLVETA